MLQLLVYNSIKNKGITSWVASKSSIIELKHVYDKITKVEWTQNNMVQNFKLYVGHN